MEDIRIANIPITAASANVADANFLGSIKESAANEPAITPIATVNTIRLSLQLFAFSVAFINATIIVVSIPIATIPFAR